MAKVTSSSNRSKRSTNKPVTQGQNPQRANRQTVSQARVSSAATRATTGSARVTTGKGGASGGRQPRAITNGSSNTMRQIRAKAVQANRQAQGKPVQGGTKGRALTLPNSARAGKNLVRAGAVNARTIGDSGRVRAAQAQGARNVTQAQARRGARAATQNMTRALTVARGLRNAASAARMAGPVGAAAAVMAPRPVAPGTITAAQGGRAPSRFMNARDVAFKKAKAIKGSPVVGPRKSTAGQFDSAFAAARKAGKGTFTFKGKKYTTKVK